MATGFCGSFRVGEKGSSARSCRLLTGKRLVEKRTGWHGFSEAGFWVRVGAWDETMNEPKLSGKLVNVEGLLKELFSDECRPSLRWPVPGWRLTEP
jgi:hypothetical protein